MLSKYHLSVSVQLKRYLWQQPFFTPIRANIYGALSICEERATYITFIITLQHSGFIFRYSLIFVFVLIFDLTCIRPGFFQLQETIPALTNLSPEGTLLARIIENSRGRLAFRCDWM